MRIQRSLGLVVEGNSTSSAVLRLPSFAKDLGPIKAGALRVARRASNFLRAGYAVSTYQELQAARLILIRVPDSAAPRIVEEMSSSEMALKDVAVVLCDTCLDTRVLRPLQGRGASTATLAPVQTIRHSWFILEGQLSAVRQMRRLIESNDARAFEIRAGTKPLYFAAQLLATVLPMPLFAAAQQALRSAGISGNQLHALLEEMSIETFRAFSNGVRMSWPGARTGCAPETADEYFESLRTSHAPLMHLLEAHIKLAFKNAR